MASAVVAIAGKAIKGKEGGEKEEDGDREQVREGGKRASTKHYK